MDKALVSRFIKKGYKLATAESCTGGLVAKTITDTPGVSEIFECGVVCYSNRIKHQKLGVPQEILDTYGAVSPQTAEALAKGIAEYANADIGISTTGIAGPTGATAEKPVGLIYFAIYSVPDDRLVVKELRLNGTRAQNRAETVKKVFEELKNMI